MKMIKTSGNTKIDNSRSADKWLIGGLSLRPSDLSGYDVCSDATVACRAACVLECGRGTMNNVQEARNRLTRLFFEDRQLFLQYFHADLFALERKAEREGKRAAFRGNVASDLPWELIDPTLFTLHPNIQWYDYTKNIRRFKRELPANYSLTYSLNEDSNPEAVLDLLRRGFNVAVVTDTHYWVQSGRKDPLPEEWTYHGETFEMVDGDVDDLRIPELDGRGRWIGLRGKGGKANVMAGVKGGFIQVVPGGRIDLGECADPRITPLTISIAA